jgi:hypothetical protein
MRVGKSGGGGGYKRKGKEKAGQHVSASCVHGMALSLDKKPAKLAMLDGYDIAALHPHKYICSSPTRAVSAET